MHPGRTPAAAGRLVLGLLSDCRARTAGRSRSGPGRRSPKAMQCLLCRAAWDADADAVRDDVREYVVEHLHDEVAVLVVDGTGDVKKGTRTVGVQRQYTGTAGRIENSQVAVYLVWAVIDFTAPGPGHRQLLIRRNRTTGELAYYRCHSAGPVPLHTLVRTAGSRWRVEETFQTEKGLAGLDEHQVRRYPSWSPLGHPRHARSCLPRRRPRRQTHIAPDRTTWRR
ncbi:transposase [Streptomyces sp. BE147]|uniref:transposase n=1 Tax=Streptomyces sp. BE147 TaxID=3002524 RepID=UPI002E7839D6|nr:transposase [Streptomyces sp. BE147]MEE1735761.1 transposase [Streptomyces sp. BE147]